MRPARDADQCDPPILERAYRNIEGRRFIVHFIHGRHVHIRYDDGISRILSREQWSRCLPRLMIPARS